jgi:hypothetical protein
LFQCGPAAAHQIPDGHGEFAGHGGDRQVETTLGAFCFCTERTNPLTAKEIAPFLYFTPMATTSL